MTVVVPLHEPWLALADPKITFGGRVSVTTAFVAFDAPPFVTWSVYVTGESAVTGSGASAFVIGRGPPSRSPPCIPGT